MDESGGNSADFLHGGGNTINIKVYHGSNQHDVVMPSHSTFGDLKRVIAQETGLDPKVQNMLFRGKEKGNNECLNVAGLKDNAKVILIDSAAGKDTNLEDVKEPYESSRGCEAVAKIREEIDNFADQVAAVETVVCSRTQISEKDIVYLTEMLMRELLKLDGIDAQGQGKVQRKTEVLRVQGLVEILDNLKVRNSSQTSIASNEVLIKTQHDDDSGSGTAPASLPSSTNMSQEWEVFE